MSYVSNYYLNTSSDEFSTFLKTHLDKVGTFILPTQVESWLNQGTIVIKLHYFNITIPQADLIFQKLEKSLRKEKRINTYAVSISILDAQEQTILKELNLKPKTNSWSSHILLETASLGLLATLVYSLTRSCLTNQCPILAQTQQFEKQSLNLAVSPSDLATLNQYKQKLSTITESLSTVPIWSDSYSEASLQIPKYQKQLADLDILIEAVRIASDAFNEGKKLPLSAKQWEIVNKKWENSISILEQITSPEAPLSQIIKYKLKIYQVHSHNSKVRWQKEEESTNLLILAKNLAKLAQKRQYAALTVADWQLVHATWQSALNTLESVDSGTTALVEATHLIGVYRTQLSIAKKEEIKEQFANRFSQKALKAAEFAKSMEQKNEWRKASLAWRSALNYLQQIPSNSFQEIQVRPLIANYLVSLGLADQKVKNFLQLAQFQKKLDQLCSNLNNNICTYTIKPDVVELSLNGSYIDNISQLSIQAKAEGNIQEQAQILNHISTLETILQTLSIEMKKTIKVYNAQQNLVALYEP